MRFSAAMGKLRPAGQKWPTILKLWPSQHFLLYTVKLAAVEVGMARAGKNGPQWKFLTNFAPSPALKPPKGRLKKNEKSAIKKILPPAIFKKNSGPRF